MKLGGYVHRTKISPEVRMSRSKVKVTRDKKTKKCRVILIDNACRQCPVGRTLQTAADESIVWPPGVTGWRQCTLTAVCMWFCRQRSSGARLRRWENQHMLSSDFWHMTTIACTAIAVGKLHFSICYKLSSWSLHMECSDRQRTRFYATCVIIHTVVFAVLSNRVINVWNSLPMSADFARCASFKMSLIYVGLPDYMIGEWYSCLH